MGMTQITQRVGRACAAAIAASALFAVGTAATSPAAQAQSVSDQGFTHPDFYAPPQQLPAAPGALVRSEPMPLVAQGLPGVWDAEAQRIMYTSIGGAGTPVAVTGVYIKNSRPSPGGGPRPLAVLAPGTQGTGDECAPSRSMETGLNIATNPPSLSAGYESASAWALAQRGFDVVVTDYEGLGTPGQHTYVNGIAEAHAVLDAARAAIATSGGHLDPAAPVVITGYSQGGGSAARAAELEATYAPELNIKGVNAGAPPIDLQETLKQIDGTLIVGAVGYALNSFVASNPDLRPTLEDKLNDRGRAALATTANQCIGDTALTSGLQRTSSWTADGRPAEAVIAEVPEAQEIISQQRIGTVAPRVPVRLQGNRNDDVIPYQPIAEAAASWCAGGAQVDFVTDELPPILPGAVLNHLIPFLTNIEAANDYLVDRVLDRPAPVTCTA